MTMDMEAWQDSCRTTAEIGPEHPYIEDLTTVDNLNYVERSSVEERPKAKFEQYIQSKEDDQYDHAICDALATLRQVIPLSENVAINYLSAQSWWPNCENEYEAKGLPYNELLGVWHTDIVPWIRQCQSLAPHDLESPNAFRDWMINQATTYRLAFNMSEPPLSPVNYGPLDPYALQPELHHHYNQIRGKATDMMEDFISRQAHINQVPPERTTTSLWGFVLAEEETNNLMSKLDEYQVADLMARELAARLIMVHSIVPIVDIGPTAVFFRRCPFDPGNTSEIFFLTALTIAPYVDRALVVETYGDEKSAPQLLERMLGYARVIANVPDHEVKGDVTREQVCMHNLIRYAKDQVCPWCETQLRPIHHSDDFEPTREEKAALELEVELERITDQRQSVRGSYNGEATLDQIVQDYEATDRMGGGDPETIRRERDKIVQRLHELYASCASQPPDELLMADDSRHEITWGEHCEAIVFWLETRGQPLPPGAPPTATRRKILRIRH